MSLTPKKTLRCIVLYEWIPQGGKNKQQWFHLAVGSSESQFWSPSHAWKRGRCDETQMHNCSRCQSCKNKTLTYCTWAHEWFSTLRFPQNNELMDHLGSTKPIFAKYGDVLYHLICLICLWLKMSAAMFRWHVFQQNMSSWSILKSRKSPCVSQSNPHLWCWDRQFWT